MASTAISAQGATLTVPATSGSSPTLVIANLISFTGFDGEAAEVDRTNLSSTAKEKLTGLADNGNFSGEWHPDLDDPGQVAMRAFEGSGIAEDFLLTLSDTSTIAFSGAVKNASSLSGGVDAILGGSFSIAVDGALTITAA